MLSDMITPRAQHDIVLSNGDAYTVKPNQRWHMRGSPRIAEVLEVTAIWVRARLYTLDYPNSDYISTIGHDDLAADWLPLPDASMTLKPKRLCECGAWACGVKDFAKGHLPYCMARAKTD